METKKRWVATNGRYEFGELPAVYDNLPSSIYELGYDSFKHIFFLTKVCDKFESPSKVYPIEEELINRCVKAFSILNKNFGVLLKGTKGTGKTFVSKTIANTLNLPVILINSPFNNIGNFLNSIEQDIIIIFDEFEKVYNISGFSNDDDPSTPDNLANLMTLMDGVFTSAFKRLFILTTNKAYIPDAMLARPSRIRYIKEFKDLPLVTVKEILDDLVNNKALIPAILDYIKELEIITVDIIKSMAEEVNLLNSAKPEVFSVFNIKKIDPLYNLYTKTAKGVKKLYLSEVKIQLDHCDMALNKFGSSLGYIRGVDKKKQTVILDCYRSNKEIELYYELVQPKHSMFV